MKAPLKLSPHSHTGRYLPHHHTSYSGLGFIVLLCGIVLMSTTVATQAVNSPTPSPAVSAVTVQAVVLGAVPSVGPVITTPVSGQHFNTIPVNVGGTCSPGYQVNVYENDILAGAALCDRSGHFVLLADLFIGQNDIIASMINAADQSSPSSKPVTAYYDLLSSPVNVITGGATGQHGNVIIKAPTEYKGTVPGQALNWNLEVLGGVAPYAISVDWGDGTNNLISRSQPGQFTISHTYKKAGGYKGGYIVAVRAVDAEGTAGYIQLVAIVNNDASLATTTGLKPPPGEWWSLLIAWPIWSVLGLLVVSFWLGERRGRHSLPLAVAAPTVPSGI